MQKCFETPAASHVCAQGPSKELVVYLIHCHLQAGQCVVLCYKKRMIPNAGPPAEAPAPDVYAQTPGTPLAPFPGMAADPVYAAHPRPLHWPVLAPLLGHDIWGHTACLPHLDQGCLPDVWVSCSAGPCGEVRHGSGSAACCLQSLKWRPMLRDMGKGVCVVGRGPPSMPAGCTATCPTQHSSPASARPPFMLRECMPWKRWPAHVGGARR